MEIRYHGHATFELADGDTSVLIDPFLTGNPRATVAADELNPTTILRHPRSRRPRRRCRADRQAHRRAGARDRRAGRRVR